MNFEEPNRTPSTPLRGGKATTSDYNGDMFVGNKFSSPMNWPLPMSPGPSFGGITSPRNFGIQRTPVHGFGNAAIGEGRLSMGQFEFGADGELVLYSAGGRTIPSSVDRDASRAAGIKETLENSKNKLEIDNVDARPLDQKTRARSKMSSQGIEGGRSALVQIPADHLDSLTPVTFTGGVCGTHGYGCGKFDQPIPRLSTGGIVYGTDAIKQEAAKQKGRVEAHVIDQMNCQIAVTQACGERSRPRSVAFGDDTNVSTLHHQAALTRTPLSPLKLDLSMEDLAANCPNNNRSKKRPLDDDDMSGATPEMRTRKIQRLYHELQGKQEVLSYLQSQICVVDQHISKLIRTNVGLWACSAHIASCIGLALDEESRVVGASELAETGGAPSVDAEAKAQTGTKARQVKRRRSSLGVASLTQSLNTKANKAAKAALVKTHRHVPGLPISTANMAKVDGKLLIELEEIFAKPKTSEFATGEMINHLPSNVLKSTGMCPVDNHDAIDATLAPVPLQNFNAVHDENIAVHAGSEGGVKVMANSHEAPLSLTLSKENSFSFRC